VGSYNPVLAELLETLEAADRRRRFKKFEFWKPYPKQLQFMELGATKKERLLMAGNQNGKSETGAYESTAHLTGRYPEWWKGRVWKRPVRAWADGETSLLVRDVQQKKLCGPPGVAEDFGTGFIPKEDIVDTSLARGVTDAYDTIQVKHYRSDGTPDGVSTLTFKSYEQGQKKHQGEPIDFDWCDEEPPEDVYSEILTRTTATDGMVMVTFTPLQGRSNVVTKYMDEPADSRAYIVMTIEDAEHIPAEKRAAIIAAWPAHERDARARGIPMMGSGRIFPYPHEAIIEQPILHIPAYWTKGWGIDFGINHPFAANLMLWDKDNDVIHVHATIRMADALPLQHAQPMLIQGAAVPVFWPQDGTQRSKDGTGEPLAAAYRKHKLLMHHEHSTWPDGGLSTEAAVIEMQERITTGRFKVASHLADWLHEYDMYHRKDGQIVKVNDDLISATQKGLMMKRFFRAVALGEKRTVRRRDEGQARDVDFDLF
jgi:phage terminase large subunit-like protein